MRNKSVPCILSAALLLSVLMAPLASADSGDETITVNHVVLVDTPPHPAWEWNYSYQVEVNDLQMDTQPYTAIILVKRVGDNEWGGLDWWWDMNDEFGGYDNQFNFTISLQRGCYFINASLYESEDLNSDVENATVLAAADLDFVVGTVFGDWEPYSKSTCVDGVYSEDVEVSEGDTDAGGLPGFGLILSITAALGAALIAIRRE